MLWYFKGPITTDELEQSEQVDEEEKVTVASEQSDSFESRGALLTVAELETQIEQPSTDEINNLYLFDYDPSKLKSNSSAPEKEKDIFKLKSKNSNANKEETRLEILFSRCEALYAHGFIEHSCVLARLLAEYCLKNVKYGLFSG